MKALTNLTVAHVRCYADFVGGGRHLPNAVPATLEEDAAGLTELIRLEWARTEAALHSDSDLILLDRGANTLLAHRYAIERVTGLECFGPAQRAVSEAQLRSWPDLVLYLDVPQEVVHERNRGKFPPDSIFIDAQFNAGIRAYFAGITGQQQILWLDATLDPAKLVKLADAEVRQLLAKVTAG
jgi:thymidylate kinase